MIQRLTAIIQPFYGMTVKASVQIKSADSERFKLTAVLLGR
ncbi:MAG: hypothetical protein AAGB19_08480 [Cyanobacteria bacterium P01_F01_bin.3]